MPEEYSQVRPHDNLPHFPPNPPTIYPSPPDLGPAHLYPFDPTIVRSPSPPTSSSLSNFAVSPLDPSISQFASPDPRYSSDYSFPPHPIRLDSDRTVRPVASQYSSYQQVPPPFLPSEYLAPLHPYQHPPLDTRSTYRAPPSQIYASSSSDEISPTASNYLPLPIVSPRFESNYPLPDLAHSTGGGEHRADAGTSEARNRDYLERNRRAAIKSRQKKKDTVKGLEASTSRPSHTPVSFSCESKLTTNPLRTAAKRLSESNQDLQQEASSLELEVSSLRDAIYQDQPRSLRTAPDRTMLLDYSRVPTLGSQHDVYSTEVSTAAGVPPSDDESNSRHEHSITSTTSSGPSGTLSSAFATTAIASTPSTSTPSASTDEMIGASGGIRIIPGRARGEGLVRGVPRGGEGHLDESRESSEDSPRR